MGLSTRSNLSLVPKVILIADDRVSMRRSVRFLLERRHAELVVQQAVDGVEAIELTKQTKPDLILLDLAMPRLNGAEAARIEKYSAGTPIILFTMYTDLQRRPLRGLLGVDFISKVDSVYPKLLERVNALLPPRSNNEIPLW